jgi:hypothetical protein
MVVADDLDDYLLVVVTQSLEILNVGSLFPQLASLEPGASVHMIDDDHFAALNFGQFHLVGEPAAHQACFSSVDRVILEIHVHAV